MFASAFVLIAAFAPLALATRIHRVDVGPNAQLVYDPPFVYAAPGDIVRFQFHPKNHTVTQSAFDPPCVPLAGGQGFTTGFVPVANDTIYPNPQRDFEVPDNNGAPLWFYCQQIGHCGQGMVFAINPPADHYDPHSFDAFKALAIARNGTANSTPTPAAEIVTSTTYYGAKQTASPAYYDASSTKPYVAAPAVTPTDHRIVVGINGMMAYGPANITAAAHDTVTFVFVGKNDTATQSSFGTPCNSLIKADGTLGFNSGFKPVGPNTTVSPTFTITINDTAPIWGYCGQINHCQSGMVFSINANEAGPDSFEAFRQLALQTPKTITPA